ncbi:hypothetical protein QO004_004072 [Rhizobium mesoamericanum]|nr:hypothetical protein [Rhizobium mesoamericanum]
MRLVFGVRNQSNVFLLYSREAEDCQSSRRLEAGPDPCTAKL